MGAEIGPQAWHFEAPVIARMLSPKARKEEFQKSEILDCLNKYSCDVDGPSYQAALSTAAEALNAKASPAWPATAAEHHFYTPLAKFLNDCVDVVHTALDKHLPSLPRDKRMHSQLKFIVYNKQTADGINGAAPLKPDLIGGRNLVEGQDRLYWNPPIGIDGIDIAVEVKNAWPELVRQAATYARCYFHANPLRQFALVLGFNQNTKEFRFLIFHRGGLSASKGLTLKEANGKEDILRVFLAILSWSSPVHAGLPEWWNNKTAFLPSCQPNGNDNDNGDRVLAEVKEVLHSTSSVRGRAPLVLRASYNPSPSPEANSPEPLVVKFMPRRSARLVSKSTKAASPSASLHSSAVQSLTPITSPPTAIDFSEKEPNVGISFGNMLSIPTTFVSQAIVTVSCPLDTASGDFVLKLSSAEDARGNIEAELLAASKNKFGTPQHYYSFDGRFNNNQPMCNHLFLPAQVDLRRSHWPILIQGSRCPAPDYRMLRGHVCKLVGSALTSAESPLAMYIAIAHALLGWLSIFLDGYQHRDLSIGNILMLKTPIKLSSFKILLGDSTSDPQVKRQAQRLMDLVNDMKISQECSGFVIDGDMAAKWDTYFDVDHDESRSGTVEFMSDELRKAMEKKKRYLQTPVDDLHSSYYVAQYAALYNELSISVSPELKELRDFAFGDLGTRGRIADELRRLNPNLATHRTQYPSFLLDSAPLLREWLRSIDALRSDWEVARAGAPTGLGVDAKAFYTPRFKEFACRGVGDYLELLLSHYHDELQPS